MVTPSPLRLEDTCTCFQVSDTYELLRLIFNLGTFSLILVVRPHKQLQCVQFIPGQLISTSDAQTGLSNGDVLFFLRRWEVIISFRNTTPLKSRKKVDFIYTGKISNLSKLKSVNLIGNNKKFPVVIGSQMFRILKIRDWKAHNFWLRSLICGYPSTLLPKILSLAHPVPIWSSTFLLF